MPWEHVKCGTVHEGRVPPVNCAYCWLHNTHIPVVRGDKDSGKGWRKVGGTGPVDVPHPNNRKSRRRGNRRIGPERREKLYERDGWKCVECGEDDSALLTLDHKIPRSKGGDNSDDNLQTMCHDCNNRKGDKVPNGVRWPSQKEMRRVDAAVRLPADARPDC
jgi:hypothetical protein